MWHACRRGLFQSYRVACGLHPEAYGKKKAYDTMGECVTKPQSMKSALQGKQTLLCDGGSFEKKTVHVISLPTTNTTSHTLPNNSVKGRMQSTHNNN